MGKFIPCPICRADSKKIIFTKNDYTLVRCGRCDVAYIGNPPSEDYLKQFYSFKTGYQQNLVDEDSPESKFHAKNARITYSLLQRQRKSGKILDVGCSAGYFLKEAHLHGWEAHGIEYSADTASIAARIPGLSIQCGTLENSNYEPKSFDVISLWDVIEHLTDPVGMTNSVHRILRDDGILAISTPNIDGLFPKLSYRVANRLDYWPHPEPPHHLLQFSKQTLTELLHQAGFEIFATYTRSIPLAISFDLNNLHKRSPKLWLYTSVFLPTALIDSWIGAGDWMYVFARKISR